MSIFGWIAGVFGGANAGSSFEDSTVIVQGGGVEVNPANGLPMMDGNVDVAGNPYGVHAVADDLSPASGLGDPFQSGFDDPFKSGFDDPFSSHSGGCGFSDW